MLYVDLSSQSIAFVYSLLWGVGLGIIYTLFKFLRCLSGNSEKATVVFDFLYMALLTCATYILSVAFTDGLVRYYTVLGEALAFLIYKFTLGLILDKALGFVAMILRKAFEFLQKNITVFAKKLLKASCDMMYNIVNRKDKSKKCKGVR